jgi:hypothetical protein
MATTYVAIDAVRAYLEAGDFTAELPILEAEAEAVILAAEDDVDRFLDFYLDRDPTTGRKLDPAKLTDAQVGALARATASQTAFRLEAGEDELVGSDALSAAGGVTFGPTPRPPSPAALEALSGYGFAWRSGTVAPPVESVES